MSRTKNVQGQNKEAIQRPCDYSTLAQNEDIDIFSNDYLLKFFSFTLVKSIPEKIVFYSPSLKITQNSPGIDCRRKKGNAPRPGIVKTENILTGGGGEKKKIIDWLIIADGGAK